MCGPWRKEAEMGSTQS